MKRIIAILVLCVAGIASAESSSVGKSAAHEHRGFYSNMSFAFAYNWYKNSRVDLSSYYFENEKMLISGDTLFNCSVGRSDLPTGSEASLIRSIREKLMGLPDDVKVYPGHGDTTTIGFERENNPFI